MRVTIAGLGNVGQFIAADLLKSGHDVVLLERDPVIVDAARASLPGASWYNVDACEVRSLDLAGVLETDVMVATTGDDEDNLVIALLAKQEFAVPKVVARVNNPKNFGLFTESWGVDVAVSTPHLLRSHVEEAVTVGNMVRLMQFDQSGASMHEVRLADTSPGVGRTIGELELPVDTAIVAIVREGHVVTPRDDSILASGDEVLAVSSDDTEDEVRRALVGPGREIIEELAIG